MPYDVSDDAKIDLFDIWCWIADDSVDLADRVERDFYELFETLGRMPRMGRIRADITRRPIRFFGLHS